MIASFPPSNLIKEFSSLSPYLETFLKSKQFPKLFWKPAGAPLITIGEGSQPAGSSAFEIYPFFSGKSEGIWKNLPSYLSYSPATLSYLPWQPRKERSTANLPLLVRRLDQPNFNLWKQLVEKSLSLINKGELEKIVLARQTELQFRDQVDPWHILSLLYPLGTVASLLLFQFSPEIAWISASPESLFLRQDRFIRSEALAGTKKKEWSSKEQLELEITRKFIEERLLRCCDQLVHLKQQERSFGDISHLLQRINGSLKEGVSDRQLISLLHPTPALSGYPQQIALSYLKEIEPFERGWYGGAMGETSLKKSSWAVGIRSLLIQGSTLYLFAGAGIVEGSKAGSEWEELERKIGHFMSYI